MKLKRVAAHAVIIVTVISPKLVVKEKVLSVSVEKIVNAVQMMDLAVLIKKEDASVVAIAIAIKLEELVVLSKIISIYQIKNFT